MGVLLVVILVLLFVFFVDIFLMCMCGMGLVLSYNFLVMIFGGFLLLIVMWLIGVMYIKMLLSFYVFVIMLISLVLLWMLCGCVCVD